eukprot:m.1339287 g.1339287  ORF g.1339287 m.1339287 type:complete len:604 (+) comp24885_c1_seq10:126-1937(+)
MANHVAKMVSWTNTAEWRHVATLLYSNNYDDIQSGVNHISGWIARGNVPLAVECTYHLLKVLLSDPDNGMLLIPGRASSCDCSILRLAYSMALTRFVNGFCDAGQKGFAARSVAKIAEDLEIPDFIVDVRHQSTHTALPSIDTLRINVPVALDWLRERYWEKQEQQLSDTKKKVSKGIKDILAAVAAVETAQATLSSKAAARQRKKIEQDSLKLTAEKDGHTTAVTQMVHVNSVQALVVDSLLQDGMLLPDASRDADLFGQSLEDTPSEEDYARRFRLWDDTIEAFDATWQFFSSELLAVLVHEISDCCYHQARNPVAATTDFQGHHSSAFGIVSADASVPTGSVRLHWLIQWCLHLVTLIEFDESTQRAVLMQLVSFPHTELLPLVKVLLDALQHTLPSGTETKVLMMMDLGSRMPTSLFRRKMGVRDTTRASTTDVEGLTKPTGTALTEASEFLAQCDATLSELCPITESSPELRDDITRHRRRSRLARAWGIAKDGRWVGLPVGLLPDGSVPDLTCRVEEDNLIDDTSDSGDDGAGMDLDDMGDVAPNKRRRTDTGAQPTRRDETPPEGAIRSPADSSTGTVCWTAPHVADALLGAVQLL